MLDSRIERWRRPGLEYRVSATSYQPQGQYGLQPTPRVWFRYVVGAGTGPSPWLFRDSVSRRMPFNMRAKTNP
jgi:hypothetical protein